MGRGSIACVAAAGMSRTTIRAGLKELAPHRLPTTAPPQAVYSGSARAANADQPRPEAGVGTDQPDAGADGARVWGSGPSQVHLQAGATAATVLEQQRRRLQVVDDDVQVAVQVQVGERHAAAAFRWRRDPTPGRARSGRCRRCAGPGSAPPVRRPAGGRRCRRRSCRSRRTVPESRRCPGRRTARTRSSRWRRYRPIRRAPRTHRRGRAPAACWSRPGAGRDPPRRR